MGVRYSILAVGVGVGVAWVRRCLKSWFRDAHVVPHSSHRRHGGTDSVT